jgi:hypothetical protein
MEIVERLREELRGLLDAIRCAGGGVVFEEFPGALGEDPDGGNAPDGDISEVRHALMQEANELAEVLAQFHSEEDGIARDDVGGGYSPRSGARGR